MKQSCSIIASLILISVYGQTDLSTDSANSSIFKTAITKKYDPFADIVSSSLKDKTGNLWFAASGRGVYRYDGKTFTDFTERDGLSSNDISCICEDKVGNLWFGTTRGVCIYDGKTFTSFPILATDSSNVHPFRNSFSQSSKQVIDILQDKRGDFWFVTLNHGVYRYDGKSFTNFLSREVLDCILEDNIGNIWVGSWSHGGVYYYDGKSIFSGHADFTNFNGLGDDMISCILEDKAGNIWFGTRNHGVDRYDRKSITNFSEKEGLCSNDVSCIFEGKDGNIWFGSDVSSWGTKRGDACRYDGKSFINVTSKESFAAKKGMEYSVMTITEDNTGNFWFGSRGGLLYCYDGMSFIDFSEKIAK